MTEIVFAHDINLKLGWLLLDHSLSLCSKLVLELLEDKTNFVGGLVSLPLHWGVLLGYNRWPLQVP